MIKTCSKKAPDNQEAFVREAVIGAHSGGSRARQIRRKAFAFACMKSAVRAGKKRSLKGVYK